MRCSVCNIEMISGAGVWTGVYYQGGNVDLSLSLVGKEPWGEGNVFSKGQVVLTPTPFVCPCCGKVDLVLSKRQVKKYESVINHHILKAEKEVEKVELKREKVVKVKRFVKNIISSLINIER